MRNPNSIVVRVPGRLGSNATFRWTLCAAPTVLGVHAHARSAMARRSARLDVQDRVTVAQPYGLIQPLTLTVRLKFRWLMVPLIPTFEPDACL
jgi:hypothetical protein